MEQNYQSLFKNLNPFDCQYHDQNVVTTLCINEICENYFKIVCAECQELLHQKDAGSQLISFKKAMISAAKDFEEEEKLNNLQQNDEEQKNQQNQQNPRDEFQQQMLSQIKEWIIFGEVLNNKCKLISEKIRENYKRLFENKDENKKNTVILEAFEKIRNSQMNEELNTQLQILKKYFFYDKDQKQMKLLKEELRDQEPIQRKTQYFQHYLYNLNQQKNLLEQKIDILQNDSSNFEFSHLRVSVPQKTFDIYKQTFQLQDLKINYLDATFSTQNRCQTYITFNDNKNITINNQYSTYSFILIDQNLNDFQNKTFLFDISIDFGSYYFFFGATDIQCAQSSKCINLFDKQEASIIYYNNSGGIYSDCIRFGSEINNLKLSGKEDLSVLYDGWTSKLWLFRTNKPDERVALLLEQGFKKYQRNWHITFGHGQQLLDQQQQRLERIKNRDVSPPGNMIFKQQNKIMKLNPLINQQKNEIITSAQTTKQIFSKNQSQKSLFTSKKNNNLQNLKLPQQDTEIQKKQLIPQTEKHQDSRWDYLDCIREITKAITELEIVVDEDQPKQLQNKLAVVFETRNQIRGAMLKQHKEEQLISLCDRIAYSMIDLRDDPIFRKQFQFYYNRFSDLIQKCESLKKQTILRQDELLF